MNDEALIAGLTKRVRGQSPTRVESAALKVHDKSVAAEVLAAVPRPLMRRLTGLTQGKIENVAARYGLPIDGAVVDLYVLFPAMLAALDQEMELGGEGSPALERLRAAKAKIAELDLEERRGSLMSVDEVMGRLTDIATIMRQRSEAMARVGGPAVQRAFEDMLDEVEDAVKRWYPADGDAETIEDEPERPAAKGKKK